MVTPSMYPLDNSFPIPYDSSNRVSVIGSSEVTGATDTVFGVLADSDLDAPVGVDILEVPSNANDSEKGTSERRKTLPGSIPWEPHHIFPWVRSPDDLDLYMQSYSGVPFKFPPLAERAEAAASAVASPILEIASPSAQLPAEYQYLADIPRCTSPLELDNEYSMNCHGGTSQAWLTPLGYAAPFVNGDTRPHFPLGTPVESHGLSHEDAASVRNKSGSRLTHHEQSNVLNGMVKDPEALLDNHNVNVANSSRPNPSFVATALITALGVLAGHSSNPKVAIFQLCAATVSLTLIALHSFHAIPSPDRRSTLMQQLLKHFPVFISASCLMLFLLSVIFASPKAMTLTIFLVIFASIPMVFGARLPMALTLAVITLFTLTFLALVFLVCLLPVEWLA